MAAHSSALAWRTPGTGEPGGLPSTGSHSRTQLKRLSSSSSSSIGFNGLHKTDTKDLTGYLAHSKHYLNVLFHYFIISAYHHPISLTQ